MHHQEHPKEADRQENRVEILTGTDAKSALVPEDTQELVRNLLNTTFDAPKLREDMTREEVIEILDRYRYPHLILREATPSLAIGDVVDESIGRIRNVLPSAVYDPEILQDFMAVDRKGWDEFVSGDVEEIAENGNMIVAKVGGEVAGMAGYKHIGVMNGRNVYEMLRVSVLPQYRGQKILPELAQSVMNGIHRECPDAIVVVHTKTPRMREWTVREGFYPITCAEYVERHDAWGKMSPNEFALFEAKQKDHGWEYFELDRT